nr:MAG TPA: hypothetical protein [Caudoviricetes sp.]
MLLFRSGKSFYFFNRKYFQIIKSILLPINCRH